MSLCKAQVYAEVTKTLRVELMPEVNEGDRHEVRKPAVMSS
jgi:hypothetical protein